MNEHINTAINYGIVYRDGADDIWLGKYDNGTIREFSFLSDTENIYEDLPYERFAFVKVKQAENERVMICDVSTFEIGKREEHLEEIVPKPVTEMLEAMNFPSDDCDDMFRSFLYAAGKAN